MYSAVNRMGAGIRRRDLMHLSGVGAMALTTGCRVASWLDPGPPRGLLPVGPVALDPRRFHVLAALVEALYPGGEDMPAGLAVGVPQRIDRELYFMAPATRAQLEQALDILEYGGILAGWFGRFSRLDLERRLAAVTAMLDHRWIVYRQVATALTQLVKGMYYAAPESWAAIGYDGPWMPANVPESIAAYPDYGPDT